MAHPSAAAFALSLLLAALHNVLTSAYASLLLLLSTAKSRLLSSRHAEPLHEKRRHKHRGYEASKGGGGELEEEVTEEEEGEGGTSLYEGVVRHVRQHPVRHGFSYNVRMAVVDMDRPPHWFQPSLRHHMSAAEARELSGTAGPVRLLTNPESVGYEQNPISVFYCYNKGVDGKQHLAKCIAEVTNTPWGECCIFTFDPRDGLPKPLHVSPFMDMKSTWKFHTSDPRDTLHLAITVSHPKMGNYFTATLNGRKVATAVHPEWFLWLQPHCVAFWIYWQAFLLWWKGVPLCEHPKYADGDAYRERVIVRNSAERHPPLQAGAEEEGLPEEAEAEAEADLKPRGGCGRASGEGRPSGCAFVWKDAKGWPWK